MPFVDKSEIIPGSDTSESKLWKRSLPKVSTYIRLLVADEVTVARDARRKKTLGKCIENTWLRRPKKFNRLRDNL